MRKTIPSLPESPRPGRPRVWAALAAGLVTLVWMALVQRGSRVPAPAPTAEQQEDPVPDVRAIDRVTEGTSALLRAVAARDREEVHALLEAGARTEVVGTRGDVQAIHLAASLGAAEILQELLAHGARVDVLDANHDSPLHMAARAASEECVRLLVEAHARRDAPNLARNTPLHELARCASGGDLTSVAIQLLPPIGDSLQRITDLHLHHRMRALVNSEGRTAEELAREHGHPALADYLRLPPDERTFR